MELALKSDKIDAYLMNSAVAELAVSNILPALEKAGAGSVKLSLLAGEQGVDRHLVLDYSDFPGDESFFQKQSDRLSEKVLNYAVNRLPDDGTKRIRYDIL